METVWNGLWTAGFLAAFGYAIWGWLHSSGLSVGWRGNLPTRAVDAATRRELAAIFCGAVALRLAVLLLGLICLGAVGAGWRTPLDLPALWTRWDGLHYVNLSRLGYEGYLEDGAHLFVVFFPLYVWLIRLAGAVIPNPAAAGMAVSTLCYAMGCCRLYQLGAAEYGKRAGKWAVVLLSLFPFAFFFGGVMTEGLFLLTTSSALWHLRNHRWLRAGVWGALAALTRMQGLLILGAACAELVVWAQLPGKRGVELRRAVGAVLKRLPLALLPLAGTGVYLALNKVVTGDWFSFTVQQRHWSQGFLWFPSTVWYLVENTLTYPDGGTRFALWLPQVVLFLLFAALVPLLCRRGRSMLALYGIVYFTVSYSLSWLLSGGRYLSCAVPFFLVAGEWAAKRPQWGGAAVLCSTVCFVVWLTLYLTGAQVM